jgi:beta-glucanase (GH16 family)
MNLRSCFFLALTPWVLPLAFAAQTSVEIFNGRDLSGWVKRGGEAGYAVEGGEIVGRSVAGTPNTFLCTEREFGDFVLEFEFKVDDRLNSGVQFRSQVFDHETVYQHGEKTIRIPAGRVHGYQADIDLERKRDRWWTALVYDEARRAWLFPGSLGGDGAAATVRGRALSKPGEWNHLRIEAVGDSIKTWLNGELRADFRDAVNLRGFIALQVHGVGKNTELNGAEVRWRKLKLREIAANPAAAAGAAAQAAGALSGTSDAKSETVKFDPARWTLAWAEEFDRAGAPDPAVWEPEQGYVRNGEAQYYTAGRRENARVEGGVLVIEARRDDWQGRPITSASLTTMGKRSFLYGRIEVRAKIPTGRGTWPAVWTLGNNMPEAGWPACGEIDILENVGFEPEKIHANIHCAAYNHTKRNGKGRGITVDAPWAGFHVYALEWYEDRLEFFYDDTRYFTYRKDSADPAAWPFAAPHYLLLNLAIGGAWGGQKGVDETLFPHRFEVDYVRYYQRADGGARE